MKSYRSECIQEIVNHLLSELGKEGLSEQTLRDYKCGFSQFQKYIANINAEIVDEKVCLDFIEAKNGRRLSGLHEETRDPSISRRARPLFLLLNYEDEGVSCHTSHRNTPLFVCPENWSDEYDGYLSSLAERELSRATVNDRKKGAANFIVFLSGEGVEHSDQIEPEHVDSYLMQFRDMSIKYRAKIVCAIKDYLGYLYDHEYSTTDLRCCLPKLRVPRSTGRQHLWTKEELQKVLNAVDREDPTGKRDYAILILTIYTGLRSCDVRCLRNGDVNWEEKTLHILQGKTGEPVDLPLSDPVGWAIIDYLKNGRPKTNSDRIFVRHNSPHGPLGSTASLDTVLTKYILKAGIEIRNGEHYGLHSLRKTLATNMLVSGAEFPVITQTLGHQDPKSTELYLQADIQGLMQCALDPDDGYGEVPA